MPTIVGDPDPDHPFVSRPHTPLRKSAERDRQSPIEGAHRSRHAWGGLMEIVVGRDCHGDFANAVPASAVLVPEPTNPHHRNAVRLDIDRMTVGYLARETPSTISLRCATCTAAESPGVGASLTRWVEMTGSTAFHASRATDQLVPITSADGLHMLPAEHLMTVTGEEEHQDVLEEIPDRGGPVMLPVVATLHACTIPRGKYTGETGVEVRLEGQRIGELTKHQADRHLPTIGSLIETGRVPGGDGTLYPTGQGRQVELRLPRLD